MSPGDLLDGGVEANGRLCLSRGILFCDGRHIYARLLSIQVVTVRRESNEGKV